MLFSKIDGYGKAGWATLAVVAFWLAWPLGVVLVAYLAASGRLEAWRSEFKGPGTWFNLDMRAPGSGRSGGFSFRRASSGNQSFDEYREETLRRLEDEQQEFQAFLERLRKARDKAEFDAFMAERRQRPATTDTTDSGIG